MLFERRASSAVEKLVGRVGAAPLAPSIWVMALPDTAYQAPVGAFWFISSGMGR